MDSSRFDFAFSYWILAWFIFYYYKLVPYNPKIWFIMAIIENLGLLFLMFFYKNSWVLIITYIIINSIIKLYPLWLIKDTPFKDIDFIFGGLLFCVYLFWLTINHGGVVEILTTIINKIKHNKPATPAESYVIYFIKPYLN